MTYEYSSPPVELNRHNLLKQIFLRHRRPGPGGVLLDPEHQSRLWRNDMMLFCMCTQHRLVVAVRIRLKRFTQMIDHEQTGNSCIILPNASPMED